MITMQGLRDLLHTTFYHDDPTKLKYIVPLQGDWFVPTLDPNEKSADWVGYLILQAAAITRSFQQGTYRVIQTNTTFRLSFIGPNAEDRAYSTLLWCERRDIVDAFGKMNAQLKYDNRRVYTQPVKQSGETNHLAWIVDAQAQAFLSLDTHQTPW